MLKEENISGECCPYFKRIACKANGQIHQVSGIVNLILLVNKYLQIGANWTNENKCETKLCSLVDSEAQIISSKIVCNVTCETVSYLKFVLVKS